MNQNKNNNYLWDGSGEPDQEIENLEKLLGQFKHQKKELNIPKQSLRWPVYVRFALVAATILVTLSVGLWLSVHKLSPKSDNSSATRLNTNIPSLETKPKQTDDKLTKTQAVTGLNKVDKPINNTDKTMTVRVSYHKSHHTSLKPKQSEMAMVSVDEGKEAAKQVLIALQIASTKLNIAQKRLQENSYQ